MKKSELSIWLRYHNLTRGYPVLVAQLPVKHSLRTGLSNRQTKCKNEVASVRAVFLTQLRGIRIN